MINSTHATAEGWNASESLTISPVALPFLKICGNNQNFDSVASAERYQDEHEIRLDDFVGIDISSGAVRRPPPSSADQIRKTPSSTGKIVEWEGVVESLENDKFHCKLRVVKGSNVDFEEFTTLDIDQISEGDRDLVKPGALFRLVIGMKAISGTREKFSRVVFRRLPAWNSQSIDQAQKHLKNIFQGINWADESSS